MERRDKYRYPIGKARMEPLGIIVFSSIMGTAGFSIVMEGIRQLIARKPTELPALWVVIGALLHATCCGSHLCIGTGKSAVSEVTDFGIVSIGACDIGDVVPQKSMSIMQFCQTSKGAQSMLHSCRWLGDCGGDEALHVSLVSPEQEPLRPGLCTGAGPFSYELGLFWGMLT